tara:strand:- start:2662 stop:3483 length:822 start_codon:yes stop_codon:yes gene_type:complete
MNSKQETLFEELEAGRILGDLSPIEWKQWEQLMNENEECILDSTLEQTAANLDAASDYITKMPASLEALILKDMSAFKKDAPATETTSKRGELKTIPFYKTTILPWAVAACLALSLTVVWVTDKPQDTIVTKPSIDLDLPTKLKTLRENQAPGAISGEMSFKPAAQGSTIKPTGQVIWDNEKQQGFLVFKNLVANDAKQAQYQLWIADPSRDNNPVDGGVFDIPASEGEVIIAINPKLRITDPATFVVTLEQPGGVVVSKQEKVIALYLVEDH